MDVTYTGDGRIVVTTRSGGYMQMEEYAPGRRTARALAETGDAAVPRLIECLGHDSYWGLRAYAAGVLGDYGERAVPAVPALIDCIEDEVLTLRGPAVSALVRIGDPAVLPLVGCLADEHSSVRDAAEEALVRIGGPEVVRALTEALTSEGPRLREAAEHALERIRAAGG
jgi:HEAT repeat protein